MSKTQTIRVICRIRPENEKEKASGYQSCITPLSRNSLRIFPIDTATTKEEPHEFTFDHIFPNTTLQSEVFSIAAEPLLNGLFEGINCTLFCYGQTSSGKTFTMEGIRNNTNLMGIIPRSMNYIFNKINNMSCDIEFSVKCSYIQIYNEKIQDLLDTRKTDLSIREDKKKGIWVEDSTEIYVSSVKEMEDVFTCGANNRTVSATEMNAGSSRSHSLFIVTIFQKNIVTDSTKSAKVFFVDLAGSEKMSKTGITGGMGLKEAQNINKSLMTLGMVINALTENAQHVPYRDSKLTRVLQESIGGNSQTTLIITISSNGLNQSESLSTLRFGQRAKLIKNKVVANTVKSVKELMLKIKELEDKIKKYESTKGRLNTEDTNFSDDNNNNVRLKTVGELDEKNDKCDKCEKYINELMNKRVEILTLSEQIDDLEKDKEDLECEINEKCQEIYALKENNFLCEAKDKLLIDEQGKLFEDITLKIDTFNLFNLKMKGFVEKIKNLFDKECQNINKDIFSQIESCIKESFNIISLEQQNCNEVLDLVNNEGNNLNNSKVSSKSVNLGNKGGNFSFSEDVKSEKQVKNNNDNENDNNENEKNNNKNNNEKNKLDENIEKDNITNLKNDESIKENEMKELLLEKDNLKALNEKLTLEKYQTEVIINKLNEQIIEISKKLKEKEEVIKELNEKNYTLSVNYDAYKRKTLDDFSKKEMKTMELINKISNLEDENYKLIHFSKDTFKKKFSVMDKQIKQFTLEMQKLIGENKELKRIINKKNEETNNLQIKISDLESKIPFKQNNNLRNNYKNSNVNVSEMSFITNGNYSPSFLEGKSITLNTIGDLLKKQLIPKKENSDISDLSIFTNNTNLNLNNISNLNNNNITNLINNRIIKIIRGGNKKKEVNFFKMLGNRNSSNKEEDLIKNIRTNKENFEALNKEKMEKEMREFEDDASMF
jgi:kinesin family protein 5